MVTLQDLKWIVKQPEKEEKAPTARHLLEHGKRVVSMENGGDVQLLVFLEGWALYRVGKYTTVFGRLGALPDREVYYGFLRTWLRQLLL